MTESKLVDDELHRLWHSQDGDVSAADEETLVASLQASHRREVRRLRRLTIQEVVPAVVIAAVFGLMAIRADQRWWSFALAALLCLGVGCFLLGTTIRQHRGERSYDNTVREQLDRTIAQLEHRAALFRNIFWWYLAPIGVAVGLVMFGMGEFGRTEVIFAVAYTALLAGLYVMNRRIGRNTYETKLAEAARLKALMEEPVSVSE